MIVDDDALVGRTLVQCLSAAHEVAAVMSAPAALAVLSGASTFDVVLCDVQMPGMDGIAFYDELARRSPEIAERVVFMTANPDYPPTRAFLEASKRPCLTKPFELDAVEDLLQRWIRRSFDVEDLRSGT